MNVFLTGSTGFLGGEILVNLSKRSDISKIFCLLRANDEQDGLKRIKKIFSLHNDFFDEHKIFPVIGDLTSKELSESLINNKELHNINLIIHSAANTSFSKIFDDLVEKVNLGGLEEILKWSKTLKNLNLFTYIGTATICGCDIKNRIVKEEESPNLNSKHLVKYSYTKMMGELKLKNFLPEDKILVLRPSIIMGDSRPWIPRSPVILWALATFNLLRLIPVNPLSQLDIIPVDYAAKAIEELIFCAKRRFSIYHISSGSISATNTGKVTSAIETFFQGKPAFSFVDRTLTNQMKLWAKNKLQPDAKLFEYNYYLEYWKKTFYDNGKLRIIFAGLEPYLDFIELGQLFDNTRMLNDINIGASPPAHEYIIKAVPYIENIDILEGAIDP